MKSGAGFVGEFSALFVVISAEGKDDSADGIGAAGAVVDKFFKRFVSLNALILLEGVDQVEEGFDFELMSRDRCRQGDEDGGAATAFKTVVGLAFEIFEPRRTAIYLAWMLNSDSSDNDIRREL